MDSAKINNFFVTCIPDTSADYSNTIKFYQRSTFMNIGSVFHFHTVDEAEVREFIFDIKSSAVGHDGINSVMLRLLVPHVLPFITHIINTCILENVFPHAWKTSVVIPLPKKSKIVSLGDLRPISLLPTLSKVFEKNLRKQINEHLNTYNILPTCQSGFRRNYSCTTALLKVTDDILRARDRSDLTLLVLLDFSKALASVTRQLDLC